MIFDILFLLGLFVGMFFVILFAEIYRTEILLTIHTLPSKLSDLSNKISSLYSKINLARNQLKGYIKKHYEKAS